MFNDLSSQLNKLATQNLSNIGAFVWGPFNRIRFSFLFDLPGFVSAAFEAGKLRNSCFFMKLKLKSLTLLNVSRAEMSQES